MSMNPVSRRSLLLKVVPGAVAFFVQTPSRIKASNPSPENQGNPSLSPMDEVVKSLFEASRKYAKTSPFNSQKTMGLLFTTENGVVAIKLLGNALILDESKSKDDPNRTVPAFLYFHGVPKQVAPSFNLWILLNPGDSKLIQFKVTGVSDAFTVHEPIPTQTVTDRHGKSKVVPIPFTTPDSLKSIVNFTVTHRDVGANEKPGNVERTTLYLPGKVERALQPLLENVSENKLPQGVSTLYVDGEDEGRPRKRWKVRSIENFFIETKKEPLSGMAIARFPIEGEEIPDPVFYNWKTVKNTHLKRQMMIDSPPQLAALNKSNLAIPSSPIQTSGTSKPQVK